MDWQSSTLHSKIKGRGGRRFLAPISLPDGVSSFFSKEETPQISHTLETPITTLLPKEEAHHAVSVLRLKEEELVSVFDPGSQIEGLGVLKNTHVKGSTFVELHYLQKTNTLLPSLLVGLPKQKTAETLIEKSCEIGAAHILFFIADHSVSKNLSDKDLKAKCDRFLSIRNSAIKQSYANHAPSISIYQNLSSCLKSITSINFTDFFFCEPSYYLHIEDEVIQKAVSPRPVLSAATSSDSSHSQPLIAIGPEGGFSLHEQKLFLSHNFSLLTLGSNVLRVDTAAIFSLAVFGARLNHE